MQSQAILKKKKWLARQPKMELILLNNFGKSIIQYTFLSYFKIFDTFVTEEIFAKQFPYIIVPKTCFSKGMASFNPMGINSAIFVEVR